MAMGTTPSVEGAAERSRAITGAVWYTVGAVLGGTGYAVGIAGVVDALGLTRAALITAAAVALTVGAFGAAGHRFALLGTGWQVPRSWFRQRRSVAFFPAGIVLGAGFLTPIRFPSFFVLTGCLAALPVSRATVVGATYGILRALPNWRGALGPVHGGANNAQRIPIWTRRYTRAIDVAILTFAAVVLPRQRSLRGRRQHRWLLKRLIERSSFAVREPSVQLSEVSRNV
jgi:hypothetical protein